MELVLLISPDEMRGHKNEPEFRQLFTKYKYSNIDVISGFLTDRSIEFTTDLGVDENDNTLLAYSINGVKLFAIQY